MGICPLLVSTLAIKVNDEFLTVGAKPQIFHSVQLTKGPTGVTAKFEASNYTASVVFDGYTAIIQLTGKVSLPLFFKSSLYLTLNKTGFTYIV